MHLEALPTCPANEMPNADATHVMQLADYRVGSGPIGHHRGCLARLPLLPQRIESAASSDPDCRCRARVLGGAELCTHSLVITDTSPRDDGLSVPLTMATDSAAAAAASGADEPYDGPPCAAVGEERGPVLSPKSPDVPLSSLRSQRPSSAVFSTCSDCTFVEHHSVAARASACTTYMDAIEYARSRQCGLSMKDILSRRTGEWDDADDEGDDVNCGSAYSLETV